MTMTYIMVVTSRLWCPLTMQWPILFLWPFQVLIACDNDLFCYCVHLQVVVAHENDLFGFCGHFQVLGAHDNDLFCLCGHFQVVVAHDNDLFRICGVQGSISTTNFADLPPIKPELDLCFLKVRLEMP